MHEGVLLLDHFDEMAEMLKDSFRRAGFSGPAIVLSEDAALPGDVSSLYRLAAGDTLVCSFPATVRDAVPRTPAQESAYRLAHAGWMPGEGRFFNQIELPDFWEIKADGSSAQVYDKSHLRARVFYAPTEARRIVRDVDWLDENGRVRFTDHYDLEGLLYARTTFNEKEERFCCSWFDDLGRERVVENYVTGDILVTRNGTIGRFGNRTELCVAMVRELDLEGQRIFYNSLSTPFFVSEVLRRPTEGNVLFWQERPRNDIPGNMQVILRGNSHTSKILVQNSDSCEKLLALGASGDYVSPFGFAYGFERRNAGTDNVLICTNSDKIESLDDIVDGLPQMTFHIAAVTEMSSKLLSFGARPNVRLYPVASGDLLRRLFRQCDWYLDINYGSEIFSAVKRAFLSDQLILGFSKTLHRPRYLSADHVFGQADDLIELVQRLSCSGEDFHRHLEAQRIAAMAEKPSAYRRLFASDER
jgi:accessory Sec system glycosyltransferase GtfB